MHTDEFELSTAELPEAMRTWLDGQTAVVFSVERLDDRRVLVRCLPGVDPSVIARVRVTLAKYREALMNLT